MSNRIPALGALALSTSLVLSVPTSAQEPRGTLPGALPGVAMAALPEVASAAGDLARRCEEREIDDPFTDRVAVALAEVQRGGAAQPLVMVLDSLEAAQAGASARVDGAVDRDYHRAVLAGARVETLGGRRRIEAAEALHRQVLELLAADPDHAGAHHLLGRLGAAVMRLGRATRFLARVVVGGELLSTASWSVAREHLERAERGAPCRPEHHLELARLMTETGDLAGAQREVAHVLELTAHARGQRAHAADLRARALRLIETP